MENKFNFCPNTAFTVLEKSKFKVESLLRMRRNAYAAWYEVPDWPQKVVPCLHIVLVPVLAIRMASNCWLPALNIAVAHGLLHIVGKVRGCFVLMKKQCHMDLRTLAFALAYVAKPVLQGTQACTI